jgi:DNA-binding beta-propeller fold protein YncE
VASGVSSADPVLMLGAGLNGPDDVLQVSDGSVLVGEHGDGHISRISPDGTLARLPQVVPEAEGIAQIAGVTYIADQFNARVVALTDTGVRTVLQLTPVASGENLDGIASDGVRLIVPDSPHSTLLVVDTSGSILRRVGGFRRPAGVSLGSGGAYLVADENAGAVYSVGSSGGPQRLFGGLPGVDDAVQDVPGNNHVFAILPAAGRLIDLTSGETVASGLKNPQGLDFDGAGNLIVAESDNGRLDLVVRHFALEAPTGTVQLVAGQSVCLGILRAPGDTEAVSVDAASNAGYDGTPTTANVVEVQPDPCLVAVCTATISVHGSAGPVFAQFSYRD